MLRKTYNTRPIIAVLAGLMLLVALACAGDSATPTSAPTATSPAPAATTAAASGPASEFELGSLEGFELGLLLGGQRTSDRLFGLGANRFALGP